MTGGAPVIENVTTGVYCFPTPAPEADGTLSWDSTTAVTVQVSAGGETGLGWTYSAGAAAGLVNDKLITVLHARDPLDVAGAWTAMHRACRNLGTKGLAMQGCSGARWENCSGPPGGRYRCTAPGGSRRRTTTNSPSRSTAGEPRDAAA